MNSLLGKLNFGRDKTEAAEAKKRKHDEEVQEVELRDFLARVRNGKELQVALREAGDPSTPNQAQFTTTLESRIIELLQEAPTMVCPTKLIRTFLSRFNEHLCEPAVRLPVAARALDAVMRVPGETHRCLQLGAGPVIAKIIEVIIEELELRTQMTPQLSPTKREAEPMAPRDEEDVETVALSSNAPPASTCGDAGRPQLLTSSTSDVWPLYQVACYGLQCVVYLAEASPDATAPRPGSASSSSLLPNFQLPWKSQKASAKGGDRQSKPLNDDMRALLQAHPQLVGMIGRVYGLQCRCALPIGNATEALLTSQIFQAAARVMAVLVDSDPAFIRELLEGAGILLVRLNSALQTTSDTAIVDEEAVMRLLGEAGVVLTLAASALQRWPIECCRDMADTLFADHYAAALRSSVQFHGGHGVSSPTSQDPKDADAAAQEALMHFYQDTFTERHWRDMADSLQLDTSRLVTPSARTALSEQQQHLVSWQDSVVVYQNAIRIARDRMAEIAYRKQMPSASSEMCLDILARLECTLVSAFTSSANVGSFVKRPKEERATRTAAGASQPMQRWLMLYLFSLLPMHPQQVRPAERSKVHALHRLVRHSGLVDYFIGDPLSGWRDVEGSNVQRLAMVSVCARYLLLSEVDLTGHPPLHPDGGKSIAAQDVQANPLAIVRTVLESLEHYCQLLSNVAQRPQVVAAIVPLCAIVRWAMVAKEQRTMDLLIECCATTTFTSCASALAKVEDHLADTAAEDGGTAPFSACAGLEAVVDTLDKLLRARPLLQFQLQHEPAALLHLMIHKSVRHRAGRLVQRLLCYEPAEGETEAAYSARLSNVVVDLWDITTNSREVPDDVYLCILECVRASIDRALSISPFLQTKLQNTLCSMSHAADCFLRLVHPLNAGWGSLDVRTGRSAVLATMTSLIRTNPLLRERLVSTVGEAQLVKTIVMSSPDGAMHVEMVDEVLALVFEESWRYDETEQRGASGPVLKPSGISISVQNERILEALLVYLQDALANEQQGPPADAASITTIDSAAASLPASGSQEEAVAGGDAAALEVRTASQSTPASPSLRNIVVASLLRVVARLRTSFARCRSSVWACATRHVFEHLVNLLSFLEAPAHIGAMENCLSLLTARHIDIRQLKRLLGVISHAETVDVRRKLVPSVIEILHAACHTHISSRGEPKNYVALRSRSGAAGISITFSQFPKSGYSMSMWLRWEGVGGKDESFAGKGDAMATLLSLCEPGGGDTIMRVDLSRDGSLVLCLGSIARVPHDAVGHPSSSSSSGGINYVTPSLHVIEGFQVQPQQWTHVVFTHKTSMFGTGEVVAFLNGKELRSVKAPYPTIPPTGALSMILGSTTETIHGRCWATPLHGQLNAVYVFSKVFGAKEVSELFALGANHATCFLPSERNFVNSKSVGLYDASMGDKVLVCIDPRLSEKGKLFNAASVVSKTTRGTLSAVSAVASAPQHVTVTLHEGAFTCHTSSIIDTTCSLGALQSLLLPLLVMQVNAQLPISSKGLAIDPNSLLPEGSTALRDALKLLDSLIIVDVVRAESLSLGTFPILAHVLEKLAPSVGPEIPQRLGKLCCSISEHPDVFRGSFQALFTSVSLFHACGHSTRRAFIDSMRSMCKIEEVRRSMRELGLMNHLVHVMVRSCSGAGPQDAALRDVIFSLMEHMMADPIKKGDAESVLVLVVSAVSMEDVTVAEHIMEHTRFLILSRPAALRNALGRIQFAAVLLPALKHDSLNVRCEAVRMLCAVVNQSTVTQKLFYPGPLAVSVGIDSQLSKSNDSLGASSTREDISLATVADSMRLHPFTPAVYFALRCAAAETNQTMVSPIPPLGDNERLVSAPMLVPILMLARDATRELRIQVLSDIFTFISADTQSWQDVLKLDGWFILVCDVMLADDVAPGEELFGRYRTVVEGSSMTSPLTVAARHARPLSPPPEGVDSSSLEDLLDIGIRVLSSLLSLAVCSSSHDCEEIDQVLAYIHQIRQDERVKLLAHAIQLQILEECASRNEEPSQLRIASFSASRRSTQRADSSVRGTVVGSPQRQKTLCTNPIVERNLQQFFYSVEDQFFYSHDIVSNLKSQHDGFVHVDGEESQDYDESKSRVFLSPKRGGSAEQVASFSSSTPNESVVSESSMPSDGWLHADLALMTMQFLSSCIALVNNSTLSANSATSESRARKGGMQRIYLRILRSSTTILFADNDFVEAAISTVKQFQSLLDRSTSGFFTSRRRACDVQDDPPLRSALSVISTLHELLVLRKSLSRGGSRNRFVNQLIIGRLKAGICEQLAVLKELGAFHKPSPAHLDSTHRVALKTLDWLENPACTDVDEFHEIMCRDDYKHLISLVAEVVRPFEDQLVQNIRDLAVRHHSNSVSRTQQTLKHMVLMRQSMLENIEGYLSAEDTGAALAATGVAVLGDSNAARIAMSLLASSWGKFVSRLKGTIWDVDPAEKGSKYLRLNRVEQRPLVQLKMIKDKEGTDHHDITEKDDDGESSEGMLNRASRSYSVRLRRNQVATTSIDEGNADADEADGPTLAEEFDEFTSPLGNDLAPTDQLPDKVVQVPCELSHLMHCWSCTLVLSDAGTLTILLDEDNKAYNQIVAKEAMQFLVRPKSASTWPLQDIVQIAPARRFRMRRVAIELSFKDRTSMLLNFSSTQVMRTVVQAIKRLLTDISPAQSAALMILNENPRKELARQRITEAWRHREMSNMDYLLALNHIAGRTINDLTQYPIFPWIVADYDSEVLDLTNPDVFRDLSCPVGLCGGTGRREEIAMRYQEMLQMGDVPFHYFTHYSSPAVVLYFLVRVEPYTTCQILLQGGRFDHADRMFHSVVASWAGVTKNIQDVKEMIPECFFLPELYVNNNNVRFGNKQDKKPMSNATLPAWAKGDPFTHVYKLREALECDYVSSQLHHWIDLIFGYKQRGRHAVDALNLFHPHTYEVERRDGVQEEQFQSAEERNIAIDSLDNIGQTPIQLFVKKHPERKPNAAVNPIIDTYAFAFRWVSLVSQQLERSALVRILRNDRLVVVGATGTVLVYRYSKNTVYTKKESTPSRYRLEGVMKKIEDLRAATVSFEVEASPEYRIPSLPVGCMPSVSEAMQLDQPKLGGSALAAQRQAPNSSPSLTPLTSAASFASDPSRYAPCSWRNTTVVTLGESAVFTIHAGFFDNTCVIRPLNVPVEELRFSSHRDRVVCLAASDDSRYLVTGGRDTTFIVWGLAFRNRVHVNLLFSICGHEDEPSAVALSNQLDCVVTASRDGQWMMHALSTGKLEQCLNHPLGYSVDFILMQSQCYVPNILIASRVDYNVHQYTINGALLRSIALPGRLVQWCGAGDPAYTMMLLTPPNVLSPDPSSVVFYHSFYLTQTSRVQPTVVDAQSANAEGGRGHGNGSDGWMTCIDCHRGNPQLMVSATENGNLILMRTEIAR